MAQQITGRFPDRASAQRALSALQAAGFAPTSLDNDMQGDEYAPDNKTGIQQRGVLITVDASGREDEARQIMQQNGAEAQGASGASGTSGISSVSGMLPRTAPIIPNPPNQPNQPAQRRDDMPGKLSPAAQVETQPGPADQLTGGFDEPDHPITDADIIASESARRQQQQPNLDAPDTADAAGGLNTSQEQPS